MAAQVAVPRITPDGPQRSAPIAGYTLALSWSPEFCKGREIRASDRTQCSGANGRFGFVVHGLWPEAPKGRAWPQYCPTSQRLSPRELRQNLCMMPSPRLIAHQWAKHGSCMVRRPESYFKATRILWNSLHFPEMDQLSRDKKLTAGMIRTAIADANDGIGARNIGIGLNRRGWLEEVQLCYDTRFLPQACDRSRYGAADTAAAKIWRGP